MGAASPVLGDTAAPPAARIGVYPLLLLLFGSAVAAAHAGLGEALRPVFPVASMAAGAWLLWTGRKTDYLVFVLWLFMLTPGLRRVTDLQAGWLQVNLVMLAPYTASVVSIGPVLQGMLRRGFAYSGLFAIVLACTAYGLVLATVENRLYAGSFEALRWTTPACLGFLVAMETEDQAGLRAAVVRTMLVALCVLPAYGLYQFVSAPAWDVLWMRESKLLSIGLPEPFRIRVFGTMNSPASLASFLMAGLLWVIPSRLAARPLAMGAGLVVLLLTLVRTAWLGLVVGGVFLVLFGASARVRFNIVAGVACFPLLIGVVEQIPDVAEVTAARIASLSDVANDASFRDRASDYAEFFEVLLPRTPFGVGLGISGSYQTYLDQRVSKVMDGAIMEIGVSLGVFVGGAFLLTILATACIACWNSLRGDDSFLSSCGAIVAALTLSLAAGNIAVGETGVLFWVAAGFCLARTGPARP